MNEIEIKNLDFILGVLLEAKQPTFLYETEIQKRMVIETKNLHEILHKLERDGFIRSELDSSGIAKYYSTFDGRIFLQEKGGYQQKSIDDINKINIDNDRRDLEIRQLESAVDTNSSIKTNGESMRNLTITLAVIAAVTLFIEILKYKNTSLEQEQVKQKVQWLNNDLQSHIKSDSVFRKMVIDSLNK